MVLDFSLIGTLRIVDNDGTDRKPKLMKSQAVLVALILSDGHVRSRSWLQALLWSDRQPQQAMASLRAALSDIRRHFGPCADILSSDYREIKLDAARIRTDLDGVRHSQSCLLEGFDVAYADKFSAWLYKQRQNHSDVAVPAAPNAGSGNKQGRICDVLCLASIAPPGQTLTQMQADALVDNLARFAEDLGLSETIDLRGSAVSQTDYVTYARKAGCQLLLISESVEMASGSMIRMKIIEPVEARLIWSKSILRDGCIDLDDPASLATVVEFIDVLADLKCRRFDGKNLDLPADVIALSGVRHMTSLGAENIKIADDHLKTAYEKDPKAIYLAWRAYLRTYLIGEIQFGCRSTAIEEGTFLSQQAIEKEPNNSMVLATGAHVARMLKLSYTDAFALAKRAIDLNRSNPLAWSTLGAANSFLGNTEIGKRQAKVGAKLAQSSWHSAMLEAIAGSSSLLDHDIPSARQHSLSSHSASQSFAPPLRFLSAIFCHDGQFAKAKEMADKLRLREPDFSLEHLADEGYPANSLRKAGLLESLPSKEV